MPIARFEMPDGRVARFEVPEGTTPEQAQSMMQQWSASQASAKPQAAPNPKPSPKPQPEKSYLENAWEGVKTALVGMPLGLQQGLIEGANRQNESDGTLPGMVKKVFLDAAPHKVAMQAVTAPSRLTGMDKIVTAEAKKNAARSQELAQQPGGLLGQVVGTLATAPLMPQTATAKGAALAGALYGGAQPVQDPSERVSNVALGAVGGVVGDKVAKVGTKAVVKAAQAIRPKAAAAVTPEVEQQVRVYLMRNGVDFDKLSAAAKQDALNTVGKAVQTNVAGNADAAARDAALKGLRVPVQGTRGQLTQDFAQSRNEQLLADSGSAELRELMDSQQRAVAQNIDVARAGMGGKARTKEEAGAQTRSAFSRLYEAEKAKTKAMYQQADEVEGKMPVKASGELIKFLRDNSGFEGVGGVISKAKALGVLGTDAKGNLVAKAAPARKLYELRRTLSDLQAGGGTPGKLAGDAKHLVDDMFDQVGPMYKAAAAQRRRQALTYEVPDVLQKIYGKTKGGVDPKVADEKLIRALHTSSINDIKTLKKTLLLNPKAVSRREAVELWQDMRQQMLDDVTAKAVVQDGKLTKVNYQTLKNNLEKIGDERLRLVLGPKAANELRQIETAARILFKSPDSKTPGSATAANLMLRMKGISELLEKLPMPQAARMVVSGAKVAHKAAKRELDAAEAVKPIGRQIDKDLRQRQLEQALQSVPASTARRLLGQISAIAAVSANGSAEEPANETDRPPE